MLHVQDKRLLLPDARTIAYADSGNTSSNTIVLYLHGEFNVGDASLPSRLILHNHFHFIAPSLPAWGLSSPVPPAPPYPDTILADTSALIAHLHPNAPFSSLTLYIYAHSLGTIHAQILYAADYHRFPLGRQIAGLLLLSPFSPPHAHKHYAKSWPWLPYLLAGPPSRYVPFSIIPRVASYAIAPYLKSEQAAERYIRSTLLPPISHSDSDRDLLDKWLDSHAIDEDRLIRNLAHTMSSSVAQSWDGFIHISKLFHSGWGGYHPAHLDEEHASKRVVIVAAQDDTIAPVQMAQWLAANMGNAVLTTVQGGHFAPFFHSDDAWRFLLHQINSGPGHPSPSLSLSL